MTTLARDDPPGGPRDQEEQGEPPTVADLPAVGDQRGELVLAREIRAREMVAGRTPAQIAAVIRAECLPGFCTTWIRAHRLALGIALAELLDRSLVRLGEARSLAETEGPDEALRIGEQVIAALPAEHRTEIVLAAARGLAAYARRLRTGLAGRAAHGQATAA